MLQHLFILLDEDNAMAAYPRRSASVTIPRSTGRPRHVGQVSLAGHQSVARCEHPCAKKTTPRMGSFEVEGGGVDIQIRIDPQGENMSQQVLVIGYSSSPICYCFQGVMYVPWQEHPLSRVNFELIRHDDVSSMSTQPHKRE